MAFDTFDTDPVATAGVTFSNGNLTALGITGSTRISSGIAQPLEGKTSGKWYVEFTCVAVSGNIDGVGTVNSFGVSLNGFMGSDSVRAAWGIYTNGQVLSNFTAPSVVNAFTYTVGDVVGLAIDLDNQRLWANKNGILTWLGTTGTPNPATNTNGLDLSQSLSNNCRVYPAVNLSGGSAQFTANFGATAFIGTVPSGFTAGWTNTTAGTYFGTFASTGHNGNSVSIPPANDKAVSKYTATLTANVLSITIPFVVSANQTKGVIYADSAGAPSALLGVSTNVETAGGEVTFTFTGVTVTSGTAYWFGVVNNGYASSANYSPPQTGGIQYNAGPYASPSNPFGTASAYNYRYPVIINLGPVLGGVRPVVQVCG